MDFTKLLWKTREADKSAVGAINRPLRPVGGLPVAPIYHGHMARWWGL